MGDIVELKIRRTEDDTIDMRRLDMGIAKRKLSWNIIEPSQGNETMEAIQEHAAEPIKSLDDIRRISRYLIENGRYRDNMLFIVGINFGLRVSDLLRLKFCMLLDDTLMFRNTFPILEKKTSTTRKIKKNRYVTINDAVVEAVTLYLKHQSETGAACHLDDYLFRSESNHGGKTNQPMTRMSVDRILKGIARETGITTRVSTHTLRKTFGYHQMVMSGNDPRKLLLLQKIFGHSTSAQTLDYIGITSEEIEDAYLSLNLGSENSYDTFGEIREVTAI